MRAQQFYLNIEGFKATLKVTAAGSISTFYLNIEGFKGPQILIKIIQKLNFI